MTFVITEKCINCVHTHCGEVCPVECIHLGPNWVAIHPDHCIDCAACEAVCPIEAICSEDDLREDQQHLLELNAFHSQKPDWTPLLEKKDPLPDADHWEHQEKTADLIRDHHD